VAIVQKGGIVSRVFECRSIEEDRLVTLADGSVRRGCFLRAEPSSLRKPAASDPARIGIRWYALGQFRYCDGKTWKPVIVTEHRGDRNYLPDEIPLLPTGPRAIPFQGGVPDCPKNAPESELVRAYVAWIGVPERFGHHRFRRQGLVTDLFDCRWWRIIEAKVRIDRVILRTAVGQLLDYQRCYERRHPSLGVLLSAKPSRSDREFLAACNVTAVWKTPSGRFYDSTEDWRWSRPNR
jgi:hypothetical protein